MLAYITEIGKEMVR